jgi:hypothetical protein
VRVQVEVAREYQILVPQVLVFGLFHDRRQQQTHFLSSTNDVIVLFSGVQMQVDDGECFPGCLETCDVGRALELFDR